MSVLTGKDFQKLSEAVAEDFVSSDIPLNEAITKVASDMSLNQEQICRLCEATNNTVFNKLLKAKTAEDTSDRSVEFDVADSKAVLSNFISETEKAAEDTSVPALEFAPLPNEVEASPMEEKTASVNFELRKQEEPKKEADTLTLRKVAENLKHQKIAAQMQYEDTLKTAKQQFKKLYKNIDFKTFEKQAAARYGQAASKPLNDLRKLMSLPEVEYNVAGLEKSAGYVDDTTQEMQLIKSAINLNIKLAQYDAAIEKLRNYHDAV